MTDEKTVYPGLKTDQGTAFKFTVSVIFGLLGFFMNFHTIDFSFPPYTATVLIGLLFPMLIAQVWGWKYGLLSALAGGSQSMWWLWGPSNGYAVFSVVPPFTLWILWHGFVADLRRKADTNVWWQNKYVAEIPFRLLSSINLYTLTRWLVTLNPPPWSWATNASDTVPLHFSSFVVIKQMIVGYIILLFADVLLNSESIRKIFRLKSRKINIKTDYIISASLLLGILFWIVDSFFNWFVFRIGTSFLDSVALNVPPYSIFIRCFFIVACLVVGLLTLKMLRRQSESEKALRDSESKYRQVLENLNEAVFRVSVPDGKFDFITPAVLGVFGYTMKEMTSVPFFMMNIIHPDFKDSVSQHWEDVMCGRITPMFEFKVIDSGGNERWILQSNTAVFDENRKVVALEGVCRDITERKKAEEERERLHSQIREQARQMIQILDTVPEGMILLDADHRIILANPLAKELLLTLSDSHTGDILTRIGKYQLVELLTTPLRGLWHELVSDDRSFEIITRPMEYTHEPLGWVLVIRDVTHERNIQQRIQQQEQLASVGQMAAGIAHDFNNIMAVIVLCTDLGLQLTGLTPELKDRLTMISNQADRASKLIQQLLDFSRRSVIERKPMDFVPFLKEQVELLKRTLPENIRLDVSFEVGKAVVNADPTRIQQIILNLAVNARDAMQNGGELLFSLRRSAASDNNMCITCDSIIEGERVCLEVTDTGEGIPADALGHIFEPFFTTKEAGQGTGLGLAQVYGIVIQHDGHIRVSSKVGEGTKFVICMPVLLEHQQELIAGKIHPYVCGNGEVILIVEDDPVVREVLSDALEALHYSVVLSENGREALTVLETREDIALIMSDMVMPEMGGQALFHALKKRGLTIPVVMLSGHPMEIELERLREKGLAGWLQKPPSIEQLARILARVLTENNRDNGIL